MHMGVERGETGGFESYLDFQIWNFSVTFLAEKVVF